jgi:hypothetical protein
MKKETKFYVKKQDESLEFQKNIIWLLFFLNVWKVEVFTIEVIFKLQIKKLDQMTTCVPKRVRDFIPVFDK